MGTESGPGLSSSTRPCRRRWCTTTSRRCARRAAKPPQDLDIAFSASGPRRGPGPGGPPGRERARRASSSERMDRTLARSRRPRRWRPQIPHRSQTERRPWKPYSLRGRGARPSRLCAFLRSNPGRTCRGAARPWSRWRLDAPTSTIRHLGQAPHPIRRGRHYGHPLSHPRPGKRGRRRGFGLGCEARLRHPAQRQNNSGEGGAWRAS